MKIKRILFTLVAIMLFALVGCVNNTVSDNSNEQFSVDNPKTTSVKFLAKSGSQDKILSASTGDIYQWNEFPNSVILTLERKKLDNLVGTEKKYTLYGTEHTLNYFMTVINSSGDREHRYKDDNLFVFYNDNDEIAGFLGTKNSFIYKYAPTTKEQREELAKQAVQEFLSFDATQFVYSEIVVDNENFSKYRGLLSYYINGKKIDKQIQVWFDKDGKLCSCFLLNTYSMDGYDKYPDFDRDECYKVAEAKLMEKLEDYKRSVSYGNIDKMETYWWIGEKLYYKFRFGIDETKIESTDHQLITDQERLNNTDCVVDIYVELITE